MEASFLLLNRDSNQSWRDGKKRIHIYFPLGEEGQREKEHVLTGFVPLILLLQSVIVLLRTTVQDDLEDRRTSM